MDIVPVAYASFEVQHPLPQDPPVLLVYHTINCQVELIGLGIAAQITIGRGADAFDLIPLVGCNHSFTVQNTSDTVKVINVGNVGGLTPNGYTCKVLFGAVYGGGAT